MFHEEFCGSDVLVRLCIAWITSSKRRTLHYRDKPFCVVYLKKLLSSHTTEPSVTKRPVWQNHFTTNTPTTKLPATNPLQDNLPLLLQLFPSFSTTKPPSIILCY